MVKKGGKRNSSGRANASKLESKVNDNSVSININLREASSEVSQQDSAGLLATPLPIPSTQDLSSLPPPTYSHPPEREEEVESDDDSIPELIESSDSSDGESPPSRRSLNNRPPISLDGLPKNSSPTRGKFSSPKPSPPKPSSPRPSPSKPVSPAKNPTPDGVFARIESLTPVAAGVISVKDLNTLVKDSYISPNEKQKPAAPESITPVQEDTNMMEVDSLPAVSPPSPLPASLKQRSFPLRCIPLDEVSPPRPTQSAKKSAPLRDKRKGPSPKISPLSQEDKENISPPRRKNKVDADEEEDPSPYPESPSYSPPQSPSYSPPQSPSYSPPQSPTFSPQQSPPMSPLHSPLGSPSMASSSPPRQFFDVASLIRMDQESKAKSTPSTPALPPITPNGSVLDAAIEAEPDIMEGEDGPCITLLTPLDRDNVFYIVYLVNHPEKLPLPQKVVPDWRDKKTYIYMLNMEEYNRVRLAKWDQQIGVIHAPPNYNPYAPRPPYFRTYFAGLSIRNAEVRNKVKTILMGEGLDITEVVLSRNEELLAVYCRDLKTLAALLRRKVSNGFIIIPAPNKSGMATVLVPKFEFTATNAPDLHKIKMEKIPDLVDPRMVEGIRTYVEKFSSFVSGEDILFFLPNTRKGSSATTPYGILWVRGLAAFRFLISARPVPFTIKNTAIVFKKPDPYVPKA